MEPQAKQLLALLLLSAATLLRVVFAFRLDWSTAPARPEQAKRSVFFRHRVGCQRLFVVLVVGSAALLLAAVAVDRYMEHTLMEQIKYGRYDSAQYVYDRRTVTKQGAVRQFNKYNYMEEWDSDMRHMKTRESTNNWGYFCDWSYRQRGPCEMARDGSYTTLAVLIAALVLLVLALLLLVRTNRAFNRVQAQIKVAADNGLRIHGLQSALSGGSDRAKPPPPELLLGPGQLQCQLVTPAVACCVALAAALAFFAVMTYALVVYTYFSIWVGGDRDAHFGVSWCLALTALLLLQLAELFVRAQLRHGARPDYSALQTFPSAVRGDGATVQVLDSALLFDPVQPSYPHIVLVAPSQLFAPPAIAAGAAAFARHGGFAAPTVAALPVPAAAGTDEGRPGGVPVAAVAAAGGRPHFCPFCGGRLDGLSVGARFCGNCGQPWA